MSPSALTYDILIGRLTAWAESSPDVRAALIIGSRARTDHPAERLDAMLHALPPDAADIIRRGVKRCW
jgi:hypothetical protein